MTRNFLAMSLLVLLLLVGIISVNHFENQSQGALSGAVASDKGNAANGAGSANDPSSAKTVSAPLPSLIVIDPGHGGDDPGAPSVVGVPEKDITLAIATKLADDLRQDGYRVVMTRTTDVNYSLAHRLSYSLGPDKPAFYLSVHANSFEGASSVRGMEIHIYDPHKYTNPKYPGIPAAAAVTPQSKAISKSIIRAIKAHPTGIPVRSLTGQSDGIRYDADYLVRLNPVPSALIELGYLSNPLDAKLLTDKATQALYAKDIEEGIANAVPKTEPAAQGTDSNESEVEPDNGTGTTVGNQVAN